MATDETLWSCPGGKKTKPKSHDFSENHPSQQDQPGQDLKLNTARLSSGHTIILVWSSPEKIKKSDDTNPCSTPDGAKNNKLGHSSAVN